MNTKKDDVITSRVTNNTGETWWDVFIAENQSDPKILKIIEIAKEVDEDTTRENNDRFKKAIDSLPKQYKEAKAKLERRHNTFEKRLEREIGESFATMLKYYRKKRGLSLVQLGEMINVSGSYIFRIESGERSTPSYPLIVKMADALDVSIVDLLGVPVSGNGFDSNEKVPFSKLLFTTNVYLGEADDEQDKEKALLSQKEKKYMVELMNYIFEMQWGDKKHVSMMEVAEKIDELKISIEKRKIDNLKRIERGKIEREKEEKRKAEEERSTKVLEQDDEGPGKSKGKER